MPSCFRVNLFDSAFCIFIYSMVTYKTRLEFSGNMYDFLSPRCTDTEKIYNTTKRQGEFMGILLCKNSVNNEKTDSCISVCDALWCRAKGAITWDSVALFLFVMFVPTFFWSEEVSQRWKNNRERRWRDSRLNKGEDQRLIQPLILKLNNIIASWCLQNDPSDSNWCFLMCHLNNLSLIKFQQLQLLGLG